MIRLIVGVIVIIIVSGIILSYEWQYGGMK